MSWPGISNTDTKLARRQGDPVALHDTRTNAQRLLASGTVETDNPCDCLFFDAALVCFPAALVDKT